MKLNRKRTSVVITAILLIVGLFTWFREPLLAGMGWWLVVVTPIQEADLVVALGGGPPKREEEAVRLLKRGLARRILFLGNLRPWDYRRLDIPAERAIPVPAPVHSTYEDAMVTREVVQERGLWSVLIVTSPYHLRRAQLIFGRVFRGTGVTLIFSPSQREFPMEAWWRSHLGRKLVIREYLGLVYYWVMYWG